MNYFDNGPLINSLEEAKTYNTSSPTKTNSVVWIVLVGLFLAGGSFYYWHNHKKKDE